VSSKIDIPLVIFAGGKSSRMGEDKSLLAFGGYNSLAEYQLKRFEPFFESIYISSKENKFDFETNLLLDTTKDIYSPLIAIESIFQNITYDSFVAISVDTPYINIETIKELVDNNNIETIATVAKSKYIEPLCCVYNRSILPIIKDAIKDNNHKINRLLKDAKIITFSKEQFTNLNYKDEYLKAIKNNTNDKVK
jgi:molybdopterin-guanine dinucleotide biosynthesis protein A